MATTFYAWAKSQQRRNDAVGDVARDVCADKEFPRDAVTCPDVFAYLTEAGTGDRCLGAFVMAFREMRAAHPLRRPSRSRIASASMRAKVLERDGFRCRRCGTSPADGARLVLDHIRPFVAGGRTEIGNLQTLCVACNAGKGARTPHPHDLGVH